MLNFSNTYIDLGEQFFKRVLPQKVAAPKLLLWNNKLANSLFISEEQQKDHALLSQYFSGNKLPESANSVALAYSGHQFGHFNPQLGDGRAHLLGEVIDNNKVRRDIQLKGSGQTPFSRQGDGRCALAPALREYIMSEALYALGVPTSRCLAVVSTGETIYRGTAKAGAVVTRVAASHIRVGTFQYFAARGDTDSLTLLLNYTIDRHFPEINSLELMYPEISSSEISNSEISNGGSYQEQRILMFLEKVIDKQITLVVEWLRIGFIHGVMNTDNTAISGETIDFGPCAMMGSYDENAVFSSIDEYGRYAYGNQGKIAQWNMARLADCLLPLLIDFSDGKSSDEKGTEQKIKQEIKQEIKKQALEKVEKVIHQYTTKFDTAYYVMYAKKLGMTKVNSLAKTLIDNLLTIMQTQHLDYTQTFHYLTQSLTDPLKHNTKKEGEKEGSTEKDKLSSTLSDWYTSWIATLKQVNISKQEAKNLMTKNNPVVIPRNHHIEVLLARCEHAIDNSKQHLISENIVVLSIVDEFLHVIRSPYQTLDATKNYQDIPKDNDKYYQTFCGT